jgi:hypothetical protein
MELTIRLLALALLVIGSALVFFTVLSLDGRLALTPGIKRRRVSRKSHEASVSLKRAA